MIDILMTGLNNTSFRVHPLILDILIQPVRFHCMGLFIVRSYSSLSVSMNFHIQTDIAQKGTNEVTRNNGPECV